MNKLSTKTKGVSRKRQTRKKSDKSKMPEYPYKKTQSNRPINRKHRKKRVIKQKKKIKQMKRRKLLIELGVTGIISIILFLTIAFLTFSVPKVDGYSMTPTTNDKDRLFVNKWGKIKRFRLIYFKEPEKNERIVSRVIGLPGDRLFYKEGQLFVNEQEVAERFLSALAKDEQPLTPNFTLEELLKVNQVPEGKYFVLGDNRSYATDSRFFGFVDKRDIVGVVELRLFPIHSMTHF